MKRTTPILAATLFLGASFLFFISCASHQVESQESPTTTLKSETTPILETNQETLTSSTAKPFPSSHKTSVKALPVVGTAVAAIPTRTFPVPDIPKPAPPTGGHWWYWLLLVLLLLVLWVLGGWLWSRYQRAKANSVKESMTYEEMLARDARMTEPVFPVKDTESTGQGSPAVSPKPAPPPPPPMNDGGMAKKGPSPKGRKPSR